MVTESNAREAVAALGTIPRVTGIERIESGSNDSFRINTPDEAFVAKFNTFSRYRTFQAEVRALQFLHENDLLPVPEIVAVADDRHTRPEPFFVTRYIDATAPTPLDEVYDRHLVRQMGAVVLMLDLINDEDATGYGRIESDGPEGMLYAEGDSWREYYSRYVEYVLDRAEYKAPRALKTYVDPLREALRSQVVVVPDTPDPAIVLPDLRLDNLLVDAQGDVATVLDFERADLGDARLTLANTHYLLGRGLPDHLQDRLREDLTEGFAFEWMSDELEHTYRLGALAKEVRAFDHWWGGVPDEEYDAHLDRMISSLDAALSK